MALRHTIILLAIAIFVVSIPAFAGFALHNHAAANFSIAGFQ